MDMDTLSKSKKIQGMNSYKAQFLHNLIIHLLVLLIALTCSLFCFYPYWFPSPIKKLFLFLSLPNTCTFIFSPKCLFIVVNVIVIFLVGESKLVGSHSSSPTTEIYDEYVERSRRLRGTSTLHQEKAVHSIIVQEQQVIKEEVKEVIEEEEFQEVKEEEEEEAEVKEVEVALKEEDEEKEIDREEEIDWPAEELNKRVEEFIARVNRQRWLEEARLLDSRLLVCCSA